MLNTCFTALLLLFLTGLQETNSINNPAEEIPLRTTLKYDGFKIIIHDFKGYESQRGEGIPFYDCMFGGCDTTEARLVIDKTEKNGEPFEFLLVKKDSLHLSEDLDNRINNTIFEVITDNKNEEFKISFCYLSSLHEIFDSRSHSDEEMTRLYEEAKTVNEKTEFVQLKDSAGRYFTALSHTADMEAITVIDGKIVPLKAENSPAQMNAEELFNEKELNRIKNKYQLKDTLVIIPGEYDIIATLTNNKKLYEYIYDAYVFRLDRFANNKFLQTKYIVISIAYGC